MYRVYPCKLGACLLSFRLISCLDLKSRIIASVSATKFTMSYTVVATGPRVQPKYQQQDFPYKKYNHVRSLSNNKISLVPEMGPVGFFLPGPARKIFKFPCPQILRTGSHGQPMLFCCPLVRGPCILSRRIFKKINVEEVEPAWRINKYGGKAATHV